MLEDSFGLHLKSNRNSFESCFQFVSKPKPGHMKLRIKVYNKLLAFLQSRTAMMGIGTNLAAVYYSVPKMFQELREACHDGLARIEISYYPANRQQERQLFKEDFGDLAEVHLNLAQAALCRLDGVCHELPMKTLFEHFQQEAKAKQLLVQMPHVVALIFAANEKAGSYTGFFKHIPLFYAFDHQSLLAANALPGPHSVIHCLLYPNGPQGGRLELKISKKSDFAQFPGLTYRMEALASLPRPKQWYDGILDGAVLRSIKLEKISDAAPT